MMKISILKRTGRKIVIGMVIALVAGVPAYANDAGSRVQASETEGRIAAPAPVAKVTIVQKKHQWVITRGGERYRVSHGTLITHPDGRQVSLRKLKVPCKVKMIYQNDGGVRKAHRIKIVHISDRANTSFTRDMPE